MAIITITRQMGSYGDQIGDILSKKLGYEYINRERLFNQFIRPIANDQQLRQLEESPKQFLTECQNQLTYLEYLDGSLKELAGRQSAIMVGFGSQIFFKDDPEAIHVRIIAPNELRLERIRNDLHITPQLADEYLKSGDRKYQHFVSTVFGVNAMDDYLYHAVINTGRTSVDGAVDMILALLKDNLTHLELLRSQADSAARFTKADVMEMKNQSEIEFAKILDLYNIEWRYEPKTFPIEWDDKGNVTLAFSPDFYLPKFNLYLELTTMNQRYVTMKNKKVKKLREMYPGVNVKIVYKKDFEAVFAHIDQDSLPVKIVDKKTQTNKPDEF